MLQDISSGSIRDSPFIGVPIEEEATNMPLGSSPITRKKRGGNQPKSAMQKKRNTRTSLKAEEEAPEQARSLTMATEGSMERTGVTASDIPRFSPPCNHGAKSLKLTKNHKYQINILTLLMGMKCTFNIVSCLTKMKYEYHDLLAYIECTMDPF